MLLCFIVFYIKFTVNIIGCQRFNEFRCNSLVFVFNNCLFLNPASDCQKYKKRVCFALIAVNKLLGSRVRTPQLSFDAIITFIGP